jgi:hypothetical protein
MPSPSLSPGLAPGCRKCRLSRQQDVTTLLARDEIVTREFFVFFFTQR